MITNDLRDFLNNPMYLEIIILNALLSQQAVLPSLWVGLESGQVQADIIIIRNNNTYVLDFWLGLSIES